MSKIDKLLVFSLAGLQCALPLADIERILRAVAISPVPRAPAIVQGLINVQGRIIPVLNIRTFFRLSDIEIGLNDQIIVARTANHPAAIVVDNVQGVTEYRAEDIIEPDELYPGFEYLDGVAKLKGGILYIYNLDRFFSSEDAARIQPLLSQDGQDHEGEDVPQCAA